MAKVEVYASAFCPYCRWARALLAGKHVDYILIDVDREPQRRREMQQRGGRHTVPQIFIDDAPIGGFDELSLLDQHGRLEALLGSSGSTS